MTLTDVAEPRSVTVDEPRRHRQRGWSAYWYLFPALVLLAGVLVVPAITTVGFSLTDISLIAPTHFVGFANYVALVHDSMFRQALVNTAYYTVGATALSLVIALLSAVALNARFRGRTLFRALLYSPVLTSSVAAAVIWLYIYEPQLGLLNGLLGQLHLPQPQWLQSETLAMPSLIIMSAWSTFGTNMIIYLAGLQGIPGEVYEAAEIDGAGRFRTLFHITVPLLRRTTYFLLIINIVQSFQVFSSVYIMTQGGPVGRTQTVVYLMYQNAFQFTKVGYASAMSTILFLAILVFSLIGRSTMGSQED